MAPVSPAVSTKLMSLSQPSPLKEKRGSADWMSIIKSSTVTLSVLKR